MAQIKVEGKTIEAAEGMTYKELAETFQKEYQHDIVLVLENGRMRELFRPVKPGAKVRFISVPARIRKLTRRFLQKSRRVWKSWYPWRFLWRKLQYR